MISRRHIVLGGAAGTAGAALGLLPAGMAEAQAITSLQLFIPANPGGGWDATGRAIELAMRTDKIIQSFQFEHKGGAGGTVGLPIFASTKKGLPNAVMVGGMVMVGAIIANKSPVKLTDVAPLARLTGEFEVVVVPAASPFKTMKDLVAAFKADPAKVSWAGGSAGGTDHILAAMIAKVAGVDPKKIAYVAHAGGGPAQAALLGGHVSCGISGWDEFAAQVKAGKLRALAISSDKRQPGIDVPTLKEQGIDVELFNWRGVFGAPGTTADQQKALIALFDRMVKGPTWTAELAKRGWTGIYLSGAEFGKYIESEVGRITATLKGLGLAT
ncbi:MAG: tripartite tricarboxylate transporter substrate binding protein [Hyphomicrobiaceae bacterium]|nr:MAG: tripartite tricarboxylate transporter substrate binding protein [Hyphomicrobiaceae bacterium]